MSSLRNKAINGVAWSIIEKVSTISIKFILGVVLARLLTPRDFGLIGMITVFFAIAQVFVDSGFGSAYVQKKEVDDVDANTVFFTNLAISIVLFVVLWLVAPLIANFYNEPKLISLTRVMSLVILINSFSIIQNAQIKRRVEFKRKTKITLIASVVSGISGITAAYYGLGVWSLVIMQLVNNAFVTVGLTITNKWKPSFKFSKDSFKQMFSFGFWIFFASTIQTFFDNIYVLVIGKLFPASELGYYTRAKQFQELASRQLMMAVGAVSFPVFSQLQNKKQSLQNASAKFLTHTLIFIVPLLICMIVLAKPFVLLLLTSKWSPMIPYLQLISVVGLLYPFHVINTEVLKGQGKSNLNFKVSLLKNMLRVINIVIMYRFGVLYIIMGQIAFSFITLFVNTYYTRKLIDYGIFKQIGDTYKIFIAGIIAGVIGYLVTMGIENIILELAIGVIVIGIVYILIQLLINRKLVFGIIDMLKLYKKGDQID